MPEQVAAALGEPITILNLGARVTYVYPQMRVIFKDRKVADVE